MTGKDPNLSKRDRDIYFWTWRSGVSNVGARNVRRSIAEN